MALTTSKKNNDFRHHKKTDTKNLAKDPEENSGVAHNEGFENEKNFRNWLASWLKGKKLYRAGYRNETSETSKWNKKETSQIREIEIEIKQESGFGDIAIHHDFLNLSWDHILANPFIIECKREKFRNAAAQAIRYKENSSQKYQKKGKYKVVNTGIATPKSLSTGELAKRWNNEPQFYANKQAKRIYWKTGIGVAQSINQNQIIISFNEGDMVKIQ